MKYGEGQRGAILITTVIALVVIAGFSSALLTVVHTSDVQSKTNSHRTTGLFLVDGGIDICQRILVKWTANFQPIPPEGTIDLEDYELSYTMEEVGHQIVKTDADGVRTYVQPHLLTLETDVHGFKSGAKRIVHVAATPLFQFAVFYDSDLELHPGPSMTLRGRIHSNGDIYIGSGDELRIDAEYLRAVGDIHRYRKDDGEVNNGTVTVRKKGTATFKSMASQEELGERGIPSSSGFDSNFPGWDANGDGDYIDAGELSPWVIESMEQWNGTVQTGVHGMRRLVPPSVGSIQRYDALPEGTGGDYERDEETGEYYAVEPGTGSYQIGYYHGRAGLVIIGTEAFDDDGDRVMLPEGTITEVTIYDAREQADVTTTLVDLALLGTSEHWPSNGLLYVAREDSSPEQPNGFRIKNGSELSSGLTVASEGPLYVQGDYNSVQKKPAALLCDALNILSNAWDDSKAPGTLPVASETTIAAAIVAGNTETTADNYNGGFENLFRFHENWEDVNCNIVGSFVAIYLSQIATGGWTYGGDVYQAPDRNWDYDPDLNNADSLPPFAPMVSYVRRVVWYEDEPEP